MINPGKKHIYKHKRDKDPADKKPAKKNKALHGVMKAKLATASHFGNPTARRMTGYDNRSYEWPDEYEYEGYGIVNPRRGNVYVGSWDNLVTPEI